MKLKTFSIKQRLKRAIDEDPFILSHHPLCKRYEKHVVTVRGYKVCMGCLFTYSSALFTILLINIAWLFFSFTYLELFYLGVVFFGIALIRKFFLDDEKLSKKVHILFRMVLGLSLGFEITAIQFASGNSRIYLLIIVIAVMIIYNVFNAKKTRNICKSCEQYKDFPYCDGFPWLKKKREIQKNREIQFHVKN